MQRSYVLQKPLQNMIFFLHNVRNLLLRMKNQGADDFGIKKSFRKMMNRHLPFFVKFSKSTEDVILDCCG